jgi:ATP-dependent DNA helicase RecG
MLDLKPINGDIVTQLRDIEKFIYDHISMRAWIESGKMERQEKWEYPPKAIREALANAMAHRDYRTTSKVQVRIFDDRIEFWNPAILPQGWTAETLKKKHESRPFNPLLAEVFFWIKYAEEIGTGTDKIIKWCREWGLPDPDFEYAGSSLVVTLRKTKLTEQYLKDADLSKRQVSAFEHMKKGFKMTSIEYAKMFGVTDRTARNDLSVMVEKGLVKKVGTGDRNTAYVLAEI